MPKAKLKFKAADKKKLEVASRFADVKLGEQIQLGENLHVECTAASVQNFLDMDRLVSQVTGNEFSAPVSDKKK